jgi:hypothetical protein
MFCECVLEATGDRLVAALFSLRKRLICRCRHRQAPNRSRSGVQQMIEGQTGKKLRGRRFTLRHMHAICGKFRQA